MITLSTNVSNAAAAEQSGWTELVDIYLPSAISTPWGTTATLRLAAWPTDFAFFTPLVDPEPSGTRGNAATYKAWPLGRGSVQSSSTGTNDTFTISASNISGDYAGMIVDVDWRRAQIVVRKVPTTPGVTLTSADAATFFTGWIKSLKLDLQKVTISASSDLGSFQTQLPSGTFHPSCRLRFGDDYCRGYQWTVENYKASVSVDSGSTKSKIVPVGLSEDAGSSGSYGTDLIEPLANGAFSASTYKVTKEPYRVRGSGGSTDFWDADFTGANIPRWGILSQGYWLIPDSQSGLTNAALEPYIQFDFGSAKTPKLWRVRGVTGFGREALPRLLVLFSSSNGTTWTHQSYFECPPIDGQLFDWNVPTAASHRYWRICMRTRWCVGVLGPVLQKVYAYENGRNYWRGGTVKFGDSTTTVALRGISRTIVASYSGELWLDRPLPVAPVSGDGFSLRRGCTRTWNHCCEHRNWEHFGGWPEALGTELAADASGTTQAATGHTFANPSQRDLQ